ncbi:MAG: DUF2207 domain-containing protein, partial [Desulfovibrio sp.]|nr:DUF2207 domain-containing protein [Desulfovibrio sp.]
MPFRALLWLALVPGLFLLSCWQAEPSFAWQGHGLHVDRLECVVEIGADGTVTAFERVRAEVKPGSEVCGLWRDIPVSPLWAEYARRKISLHVLQASIDGEPCQLGDVEMLWPFKRIHVRREAPLAPGSHVFLLHYRVTEQIGFLPDKDALTWSVAGPGWASSIASVSCTVRPPAGASFIDSKAWTSRHGSVSMQEEADCRGLVFSLEGPLARGAGFTVSCAWPKGFVDRPQHMAPGDDWAFTARLACMLFGILTFCFLVWFKYGRDYNPGPPVPTALPPKLPARLLARQERQDERLSPACADYIVNGLVLTPRGLAGLLLSLVLRGDCRVDVDEAGEYVLHVDKAESPSPEERIAAQRMPESLNLSRRAGRALVALRDVCAGTLDGDYGAQWKSNFIWSLAGFLFSFGGVWAVVKMHFGVLEGFMPQLKGCLFLCAAVLLSALAATGAVRDFLRGRRAGRSAVAAGTLASIWVLAVLAVQAGKAVGFESAVFLWRGFSPLSLVSPLQIFLMVCTLAVPFVFAPIMDAPSREAAKLRQKIRGLAKYMASAGSESDGVAPEEERLARYLRLLPYAVALGAERSWCQRFAGDLAGIRARGGTGDVFAGVYDPEWVASFARRV